MYSRYERAFDLFTQRFQLNPSTWLPRVKPDGVYELGTSYTTGEKFLMDEGTPVYMESFSIYNVFWNICYTRRQGTDRPVGRWEHLWSFLSEVELGVYDTTNWLDADLIDEEASP